MELDDIIGEIDRLLESGPVDGDPTVDESQLEMGWRQFGERLKGRLVGIARR